MRRDAGDRFLRNMGVSTVAHAIAIAAVLISGLLHGCRPPPKPREITMFVELAAPSAPALSSTDLRIPPEFLRPPPEAPKLRDIPETVDQPSEKPRPTPKPTPKPTIERSTNRVTRTPPRPAPPRLAADQIRDMLRGAAPTRPTGPAGGAAGDPFPFAWYYGLVRQALYDAWEQPSGFSSAAATVTIVVARDGRITRVRMVRPSGISTVDQSILRAVNGVGHLPPLPDGFGGASKEIEVEFELTEGSR
jgi:TonB family protein